MKADSVFGSRRIKLNPEILLLYEDFHSFVYIVVVIVNRQVLLLIIAFAFVLTRLR